MPKDSTWEVQAAVHTRLREATGLTSLLAAGAESVLDHVPPDTAFPYIVLGDISARPHDTQAGFGRDILLTVYTYSRKSGMKETKEIMAAVFDALHDGGFSVANHDLILCREVSLTAALENDGATRRGAQQFQIITEPA